MLSLAQISDNPTNQRTQAGKEVWYGLQTFSLRLLWNTLVASGDVFHQRKDRVTLVVPRVARSIA